MGWRYVDASRYDLRNEGTLMILMGQEVDLFMCEK